MALEQKYLSAQQMEQKGGIKAQHAVYRALKDHLRTVRTGWDVEETAVGSYEDRGGVDIKLIHLATRETRLLDISLRPKEDAAFLVRVYRHWFLELPDGTWEVRKNCLQPLIRAILPALSTPRLFTRRS
jgi:hypothetical protein